MNTDHFFFTSPIRKEADTFWIEVPKSIRSKSQLMSVLAHAASFPDYFGKNWDALNDCLNDFHWITQKRIMLVHQDLPLIDDPLECANYLDILDTSAEVYPNVEYVPAQFGTGLQVFFPLSARSTIAGMLAPSDG